MTTLSHRKTFLDFFPTPEFFLLSTTGVTITDSNIKFVQLQRRFFGEGFELIHASKADNPKGAIEGGVIIDKEKIVQNLKQLGAHYQTHYIKASLPEEKAYLFTTNIDSVPLESLNDAVAFVVEENVPLTLAESVFDFEVISEKNGKLKVAVSVLPKETVNSYIKLFESADMIPVSFDLESQAISRAAIHIGDKRPHLIIRLSLEKVGFYVVEQEVVQFSTTIPGGIGTTSATSNINNLKAEMNKIFSFWNEHTYKFEGSERKIEKVILCGVGANDKNFVEDLMNGVNMPFELANAWINISSSRKNVSKISFEESLDYLSGIGLLLPENKQNYV